MAEKNLEIMRHSAAHLLAASIQELYPHTKFAIGPTIENGFYYDFEFSSPITEGDLPRIEKKMEEIGSKKLSVISYQLSVKEALEKTKDQPYKQEFIRELEAEGNKKVGFYRLGDFEDLCAGPHVENTSEIGPFKLTSIAGAYWRGDEKNKMLTRIYGTAFATKEELDKHLWQQEEAKKRDHKKIGQELELFLFHESAPGMVYWLAKGLTIYNLLIDFWREEHKKRGYSEFSGPLINDKGLWEKSGHWQYYQENMFVIPIDENTTYGVKPMNCPNAMVVYASKSRSWRDLPLRLSDVDIIHRAEKSGTLNGLLRTRKFQQDDAHIFVEQEKIGEEFEEIFEIVDLFYKVFGLEYKLRLGTRPKKFMGEKLVWDDMEKALKEILDKSGREYVIEEGEGAFYGPKVDILMTDVLDREWQMGTIQLDFQLPERFDLSYTASDGTKKTPAIIHRVIYGSLERFIAILIEHFGGNFPVWLSPFQVIVLPVSEKYEGWAKAVCKKLVDKGARVEVDFANETLSSKIRNATKAKIPYIVIVGEKETKAKTVSVRLGRGEDLGNFEVEDFTGKLDKIIKSKSLDLN